MVRDSGKIAAAPAKQLTEIAFSINGYAVELPMEHRSDVPLLINAKEATSTAFMSVLKQKPDQLHASLTLSPIEVSPSQAAGTAKYLHVGWVIPGLAFDMTKKPTELKKQTPVGFKAPDLHLTSTFEQQEPYKIKPLYAVIVAKQPETDSQVRLLVLAGNKDNLRTPYSIAQEHVFYLHLYRDGATALKERGPRWNALAQKMARQLMGQPEVGPSVSRQGKYDRGKDPTRLVIEPNLSFANEVTALVTGFQSTKDVWMLDQLLKVLDEADESIKFMPPPSMNAVRLILQSEEVLDYSTVSDAYMEITKRWQDINHMDPVHLLLIQWAITVYEIEIPLHHFRPFLVEVMFKLRRGKEHPALALLDDSDFADFFLGDPPTNEAEQLELIENIQEAATENLEDLQVIITDAQETVSRLLPVGKSTASIPSAWPQQVIFLGTLLNKLKEIEVAALSFDTDLRNATGSTAASTSPSEIWTRYGRSFDVDAAKVAFAAVADWFGAALCTKSKGLGTMLKEVIEIVEEVLENSEGL